MKNKILNYIAILSIVLLPVIKSAGQELNGNIESKYESSILKAFEKYPDLKEDKIFFAEKKLHKLTMAVRPKINFLFLPKEKHQYKIFINNKHGKDDLILDVFSYEEQVGIIGHELAHIVDYKERNDRKLIIMGAKYLFSKKYLKKLENKIDEITINHGLGRELYKSRVKSFELISKNPKYWKNKEGLYYSPDEILNLINE